MAIGGVEIEKVVKDLGVVEADPIHYRQKYKFKKSSLFPPEINQVRKNLPPAPVNKVSASVPQLEGDIHALALIDLDKEGLSEYKDLLTNLTPPKNKTHM